MRGGDRTHERQPAIEYDVEPGAQRNSNLLRARAHVRGTNRQGRRRAPGPGDAAEAGPGRSVVPRGSHDERVETCRAGDGSGRRVVRESRVRCGDADERDARRVVGVTVSVRVDCPFEPGDQLIRP